MRTGLELELLAPAGKTRFDVARAFGGEVRFGLKHVVDGLLPDGRPRCSLSVAARVAAPELSFVDDVTIRDELRIDAEDNDRTMLVICDDTRIAKWLEARADSVTMSPPALLEDLVTTFECHWDAVGETARAIDRWGQVLAIVTYEPAAHHRVCEVVTRPLEDGERNDVVTQVLAVAREMGCTIPRAAALHVHVDAEPWRDTARLCALIRNWSDDVRARLRPNPACKKLGPFPANVVRVARECPPDMPFAQLAAALKMAGVKKELDINLLGVIEPHPVQPTLEVRCLPMSLDADDVLRSIDDALAVLDGI